MNSHYVISCLFFCLLFNAGFGQSDLEGLWEGEITIGGIHSKEGYKFELYLERKGKYVSGRSYIYLDDGTRFEMNMKGIYFSDRSIYFEETEFLPIEGQSKVPEFLRKYELVYKRSIWESTLNGFWQEGKIEKFGKKRKRGRVFLKKIKDPDKA